MMKKYLSALLAAACIFGSCAARANDGAAGIGAGGLEFRQSDAVTMEKENLYISRNSIKVEYVFRNVTTAPVDMYVAFPLPKISMIDALGISRPNVPDPNNANFLDFSTTVNGQPVQMQMQSKAFVNTQDITSILTQLGVKFNIPGEQLTKSLQVINSIELDKLKAMKAIDDDVCGDNACPLWDLETIYYWQQHFEPGVETKIVHSYRPATSMFWLSKAENLVGTKDVRYPSSDPSYAAWCMDDGFWQSIKKGSSGDIAAGNIKYILLTANSWKGPIGDFVLTIDKGDPKTLLSLCGNGIKKTGATTFEIRAKNYRPDKDLDILFVNKL